MPYRVSDIGHSPWNYVQEKHTLRNTSVQQRKSHLKKLFGVPNWVSRGSLWRNRILRLPSLDCLCLLWCHSLSLSLSPIAPPHSSFTQDIRIPSHSFSHLAPVPSPDVSKVSPGVEDVLCNMHGRVVWYKVLSAYWSARTYLRSLLPVKNRPRATAQPVNSTSRLVRAG